MERHVPNAFPTHPFINHSYSINQTQVRELSPAKRGALLTLSKNLNLSNRKIAQVHGVARETVARVVKRAREAEKALQDRNEAYHLEAQHLRDLWDAENERRPPSRKLKRVWTPDLPYLERGNRSRGGVDWYRYQEDWIKPKLLPFIRQIIAEYGEAFLVLDGAPSHKAWQQKELFNIDGLTVLDWPGNSPDLNQIEPCWYDMKRTVTHRSDVIMRKDTTAKLWEEVWNDLEQEKIEGWCRRMRPHLERCQAQKGDNKFHG